MLKCLIYIGMVLLLAFGHIAEPLLGQTSESTAVRKHTVPVIHLYTTKMGAYSDPEHRKEPGIFNELIEELAKKVGFTTTLVRMPWKRAIMTGSQDGSPSLIYPLIRNPARESHFSWVLKGVTDQEILFAKKGTPALKREAELANKHVGVIRGSAFEKRLQSMNLGSLDIAKDAVTNVRKLMAGRIDFWSVTHNTGSHTFKLLGYPTSAYHVAYVFDESPVYIAGNKNFPPALAAKLQTAFTELKSSGWYEQLLQRYRAFDIEVKSKATVSEDSPPK